MNWSWRTTFRHSDDLLLCSVLFFDNVNTCSASFTQSGGFILHGSRVSCFCRLVKHVGFADIILSNFTPDGSSVGVTALFIRLLVVSIVSSVPKRLAARVVSRWSDVTSVPTVVSEETAASSIV